jgi:AsmA protein
VDTKKNRLRLNPVVKNVDVGKLVDALTDYKGLFDGIFSGSFAVSSPSKTGQIGTLDGGGVFQLAKGELRNFNLVEATLDALFGLKGISRFLERQKGELQQHKITRFDSLDGDFSMIGHQVLLNKAVLHNIHTSKTTDSDAVLDGMIALDSKTLDLKGKVLLSPQDSRDLAKQAEPLEALLNPEGRMVLPISVTGSFQKPIPFLDAQYVLSAMARYYGKKELQKGLDKLGEELGLPPKGNRNKKETGKPVEKLLKELLRK